MDVTLYSSEGCSKCRVLKEKLTRRGIPFSVSSNQNDLLGQGFTQVPMLRVGNQYYNFSSANSWLNQR
jgi:glutaredoxin